MTTADLGSIMWENIQIDNSTGNSFIDENHTDLLDHLDSIITLSLESWNTDKFKSSVRGFIVDIENHFSHEEVILRGAGYSDLDRHIIDHRSIALFLHEKCLECSDYKQASQLQTEMRSKIFSHELLEDQKYWPLFDGNSSTESHLLRWSSELETGNADIDRQHQALVSHINRFYVGLVQSEDRDFACRELKLLCAYSEYHFEEEERLLGTRMWEKHKAAHHKLIADLEVVINEIASGKFELSGLGNYLDYWLFNHIKMFDIPTCNND